MTKKIDLQMALVQFASRTNLPLLPQSAQESSSSGFFSRFDSLVPKQKLHIGMGSARG